jgi:hypothetical protein
MWQQSKTMKAVHETLVSFRVVAEPDSGKGQNGHQSDKKLTQALTP